MLREMLRAKLMTTLAAATALAAVEVAGRGRYAQVSEVDEMDETISRKKPQSLARPTLDEQADALEKANEKRARRRARNLKNSNGG
jgi:hypothetical protein